MGITENPSKPRGDLGPLEALSRVAKMFFMPRRAAQEIRDRPNWVFPLLLSMLASFLVATVIFPRLEWQEMLQKFMASSGQKLGELEKIQALAVMKAFGWAGALLAPVIGNFFLAVLLWGTAVLMEGQSAFVPIFSLQLHAQMVTLVPQVLAAGLLLRPGRVGTALDGGSLPTNLGYLLPAQGVAPAIRSLASAVDLFSLWYWCLVVVGLAIVAQVPRRRVAVAVATLWATGVVLKGAAYMASVVS